LLNSLEAEARRPRYLAPAHAFFGGLDDQPIPLLAGGL
jgi:hypothetical protein